MTYVVFDSVSHALIKEVDNGLWNLQNKEEKEG